MAVGSGLGGQLGIAKETTYGTRVAPTTFLEIQSESLEYTYEVYEGGGLAAGRLTRPESRRVKTTINVEGGIELEVTNKNFGKLLENLLGTTVTPVQQGVTTAYLQTHTLGDNIGKALTVQVGVPQLDGTVRVEEFTGAKVASAEFSCEVGGGLMSTFNIDGRNFDTTQTLAVASYPLAVAPFHFGQMTTKIGTTVAGAASADGVRDTSVSVERAMNTDRHYAGAAGLKAQPILNDYQQVTGSFGVDFMDKTVFMDRFVNNTTFALSWEFVGDLIEAGHNYEFKVQIPAAKLTGELPKLDGPDVVTGSFPFTAYSNGTDPIVTILYKSTDATL